MTGLLDEVHNLQAYAHMAILLKVEVNASHALFLGYNVHDVEGLLHLLEANNNCSMVSYVTHRHNIICIQQFSNYAICRVNESRQTSQVLNPETAQKAYRSIFLL